jgi:hypothetical protein
MVTDEQVRLLRRVYKKGPSGVGRTGIPDNGRLMSVPNQPDGATLVFIRSFNDTDHLTPLLYRLASSDSADVHVICMNPEFAYEENDNLAFLLKEKSLVVSPVEEFALHQPMVRLWSGIQRMARKGAESTRVSSIDRIRNAISKFCTRRLLHAMHANTSWVDLLFDRLQPGRIVFDWVRSSAGVVGPILKKAKEKHLPTFSLPHGMNIYSNFETKGRRRTKWGATAEFDYVVSQGRLCRYQLEHAGIPPEKIVDLGSLRFCHEWMDFYRDNVITSSFQSPCDDSKLKVVFFLSKLSYRIDTRSLLQTIELLARDENVHLIIKPHTRGMGVQFMNTLSKKYNLDIRYDTSSVLLSEWSDMALVIGSSIGLQTLHDRKLLVYPSYLDTNESYYDEMNACWRVDSVGELQEAVNRTLQDKSYRPYANEDAERLFTNNVYAGDAKRDVIGGYVRFIMNPPYADEP